MRLDDDLLAKHAVALGMSEKAIETILSARNLPPAMRMTGNRSWSGRLQSTKSNKTIQFSSRVPEYAACLMYEHDIGVFEYLDAPLRLFPIRDGRRFAYVPDYLVIGEKWIGFN